MKTAKVLTSKEVREIIAEHFGVDAESVIQSKYSYIGGSKIKWEP